MWPCATRSSPRFRNYGRSRYCTWMRWLNSSGRSRTSSFRLSTRSSSASTAERATRRGVSSRRCRVDRSASSVADLARSRWVRSSRKRDNRRSRGPGKPEVATLPRKNPRAGLNENKLDNKRHDTNVVDRERWRERSICLAAKRFNGSYCLVSRITIEATWSMAVAYVTLACSIPNFRIRKYVLLRQFIGSGCSERRGTMSANAYLDSRI